MATGTVADRAARAPGDAAPPELALILWPDDDQTRRRLAAAHQPRILLVRGAGPPPLPTDDLEDWVRLPASSHELEIRMTTLAGRARAEAAAVEATATLDADGVLRTAAGWVPLPPIELRVMARLIAQHGQVVRRADLEEAAWAGASPADPHAVNGVIKRLRRRVARLGLVIHTVTGRGFLLEVTR